MPASATDSISLSLVQNKRLEDSADLPDPDIIAAEIDSQISLCSPSGLPSMSAVFTNSIDSAALQPHPSGYGSSRSLPSGSIVENLQAALVQVAEWNRREASDIRW